MIRFLKKNWNNGIENNILWVTKTEGGYCEKPVVSVLSSDPSFFMIIYGAITVLLLVGFLIAGVFLFLQGISHALNPEYYVIQDLINIIK